MIATLVRRDASIRFLGRWLFVGPLLTLTMMGVIAFSRAQGGDPAEGGVGESFIVLLTLWLPAMTYVAVNAAERRCSRFDMELPIDSRVLWTARTIALSSAALALLAATAGIVWAVSAVLRAWTGLFPAAFESDLPGLSARVAANLLLAVAVAQTVSPALERLPTGRRLFWATIAASMLLCLLVFILGVLPLWISLAPLVVAVVIAWRTRESLAAAMLIRSREPGWLERGSAVAPAQAPRTAVESWVESPAPAGAVRLLRLISVVLRSTTKMPIAPVIGVPILLAAGYTMAGAVGSAVRGDDSIRFSMLFIISYALLSFSGLPPRRLFLLDAFPVSRRFIFAVLLLPYVLMLGLGYGVGRTVANRAEAGHELVRYVERDGHYYVSAPLRYGEIALDGDPPPATAPWGESHEVWTEPIWAGGTPVVYALFSTPPGSSTDFVAWQISRAAAAVYGVDLHWENVRDSYLSTDDHGRVVPAGGELTLAADHPNWRVRPYAPVFPVMMLLVCGLWLVALTGYLRTLRPGHTERQVQGAFWMGMVILMGLHVSQFTAIFSDRISHWVLSGVSMIAIRALADRLPGGWVGVWVACALVFFGLYRVAERHFGRVESKPGDDLRVALIQRPIGASTEDGAYSR